MPMLNTRQMLIGLIPSLSSAVRDPGIVSEACGYMMSELVALLSYFSSEVFGDSFRR